MHLKYKSINIWPSKERVQAFMPPVFHQHFLACRVITDATELFIQKPGNPTHQQASFSSYKNNNTLTRTRSQSTYCFIVYFFSSTAELID